MTPITRLLPAVLLVASLLPASVVAQAASALRSVDVRYPSGDISIAATLHFPERSGPVPAIVLIHGSEGIPRGSGGYLTQARWFTSLGYAVLVWDKRGVGETPGTYIETRSLEQSASDVVAGVEFLRSRPEIRKDAIGVYGVSQGGWIGPLAATMSEHIRFVINNSGPGVMVAESNIAQRANEWIEDGYTDADTAQIKQFLRVTWAYYGTGLRYDQAVAARNAARAKPWFARIGFSDSTPTPAALSRAGYDFYRVSRYDPDSVLRKLRVPVLAVFGDKDRHIPMPESATRTEEALRASGRSDFVVRVFSDAGHGITLIPSGAFERLRTVEGQARVHPGPHPDFLPFLSDWLRRTVPTA